MTRRLAYFEDRGSDAKNYPLLMAVYYDDYAKAKAVLEADPGQLNLQDPYAGLTALHIGIFRQNLQIVQLLLAQPGIQVMVRDAFRRRPVDMLDYTVNQEIFEAVMEATYPEEMTSLVDENDLRAQARILPLKPKGPN